MIKKKKKKQLDLLRAIDKSKTLEITDEFVHYWDYNDPVVNEHYIIPKNNWRGYFTLKQTEKSIEELINLNIDGKFLSYLDDAITKKVKKFISAYSPEDFADRYGLNSKEIQETDDLIIRKYTEFTNNNQNVRIQRFSKLPEPYHSYFKNFEYYKIYTTIHENYNKIKERAYGYFANNRDTIINYICNLLKEKMIIPKETLQEKLSKLKEFTENNFLKLKELQYYKDYYFIELKTKEDMFYYASGYSTYYVHVNKPYRYFWIYSEKKDYYYVLRTLTDEAIYEIEYNIKKILNDLNLGISDLNKITGYFENYLAKAIDYNDNKMMLSLFNEIYDNLKMKAAGINRLLKSKSLPELKLQAWANQILSIFNTVKNNPNIKKANLNYADQHWVYLIQHRIPSRKEDVVSFVKSLLLNALFNFHVFDLNKYPYLEAFSPI